MKVIIADLIHPVIVERLSEKGFICRYLPDITPAELIKVLPEYQGIILRSKIKLTSELLHKNRQLKFIGRVGSGLENIDIEAAKKLGIVVFNSPEGSRTAVGEHTVGLILSLLHNICLSDIQVKDGIWKREENRGVELENKTVGIIGYGNMGSAVARRLYSFGCNVIAYDKYKTGYSDKYVREVSLNEIFEHSDIVSLHIPLTEETEYWVDKNFFNSFAKSIYFVNTSRGKILKTSDLLNAIKEGKVLAAALDVLEYESYNFQFSVEKQSEFQALKDCKKIILTPHIAGLTRESYYKLSLVMAQKVLKYFA